MKKINILAGMLVGAIAVWGLTSCDDDRDHNPVLDSAPRQQHSHSTLRPLQVLL